MKRMDHKDWAAVLFMLAVMCSAATVPVACTLGQKAEVHHARV